MKKKNIFIVVTSLQSQHVAGFIATPYDLAFSSSLIQQLNSNTLLVFSILGKVKGGGLLPTPNLFISEKGLFSGSPFANEVKVDSVELIRVPFHSCVQYPFFFLFLVIFRCLVVSQISSY